VQDLRCRDAKTRETPGDIPFPQPRWETVTTRTWRSLTCTQLALIFPARNLPPALVDRTVTVDGSTIAIRVAATELRVLRSSALSILDYAIVSLAALEAFGTTGQPFAKQKEHGTEAVEAG
jgi:hypothetical protein